MIGGGGEQKTLRLVAQYADAATSSAGPEKIHHKWQVLAAHCEAVGRPFDEIERSTLQGGPHQPRRRRRDARRRTRSSSASASSATPAPSTSCSASATSGRPTSSSCSGRTAPARSCAMRDRRVPAPELDTPGGMRPW